MQDYTRNAQITGGAAECRPISFISESDSNRVLHAEIPYINVITLTGSFPYVITELSMPEFLTLSSIDNPSTKIIEITIEGLPTGGNIGSYSINFLVNNCVGSEPADAYEYNVEIDMV